MKVCINGGLNLPVDVPIGHSTVPPSRRRQPQTPVVTKLHKVHRFRLVTVIYLCEELMSVLVSGSPALREGTPLVHDGADMHECTDLQSAAVSFVKSVNITLNVIYAFWPNQVSLLAS
jgi:hypothetical protein